MTTKLESNLFITSMITDKIGQHKVLVPIYHKNYNFWEKRNSQILKERENLHEKTDKGGVNYLIVVIGWFKLQL